MTPTHAISADEARRLLAEDRETFRERTRIQWLKRSYESWITGALSPGWVNRAIYPEIPFDYFDTSKVYVP